MELKTRIACIVLIENDGGEILLLNRNAHPLGWCLVGGKQEEGETLIQTAIRETMEETQISLLGEDLHYFESADSIAGMKVHLYKALFNYTPEVRISGEHKEFKWLKREDLKEYPLAGNTNNFIIQILDGNNK